MGIIEQQIVFLLVLIMEKTNQAATVLAVCVSIHLAEIMIAYNLGMVADATKIQILNLSHTSTRNINLLITTDTGTDPRSLSVSGSRVVNVSQPGRLSLLASTLGSRTSATSGIARETNSFTR